MALGRVVVALCALALAVAQEEPAPPAVPQLPFNPCPVCQQATMLFDQQLQTVTSVKQTIQETLAQACGVAGPAQGACMLFVAQYGGLFAYGISVAQYSIDGFCSGVFFCPPPGYQMMQNGVFETTCNLCKTTMSTILAAMTSDQVAQQAQATIKQVCSAPLVATEQCEATFGAALMQSMETTKALMDPNMICKLLGPCLLAKEAPAASPEPAAEMRVPRKAVVVA